MTHRSILAALGIALAAAGCSEPDDELLRPEFEAPALKAASPAASTELDPRLLRRFRPLRAVLAPAPLPPAQVELGRMLYFDARLSSSKTVSCNTCHPLERFGVTHEVVSTGVAGQRGTRNAPTTYNAAGAFTQFWDGRAADVEAQAGQPILNPREMGMQSGEQVAAVLHGIEGYRDAFARAFPDERDPVSFKNVGVALGAFERGLVTPSRWDRYLAGDRGALTDREKEGARIFTNIGCMVCHTGELVGGSMFQKVGVVIPWANTADVGRQAVTGNPADRFVFKVPSLRNVAMTAPYFHDGSGKTLDDAVRMMGSAQLGLELGDAEASGIVAWLRSLSGEPPAAYIARPVLPPDAPPRVGSGP